MTLRWCKEYETHHFNAEECYPEWGWHVPNHHGDGEWETIRARNDEEAAQKAAEVYDQEDYYLLRTDESKILMVRRADTMEVTVWSVRGKNLPHYYATKQE